MKSGSLIALAALGLLVACVALPPWIVGPTSFTTALPPQAKLADQLKLEEIRLRAVADRLKAENDVRTTLLQGVAGLLLLIGAFATWRQLQLSRKQLEVGREGQITERFTRAVDQIDHTRAVEVRLGGIYALERIARDSPQTDHWPIMEVLTAYIREHTRWSARPKQEHHSSEQAEPAEHSEPAIDIQAALTVLGRRARTYGNGEDHRLDLRNSNLRGAVLVGAHLEGANLWDAHLEGANLWNIHLQGANLQKTHLDGANLGDANLEKADLQEAHLIRTNLGDAHLENAILTLAHLEGAILPRAHLEGAILQEAYLGGANLADAHLEGAMLALAHMEEAMLQKAHLDGAILQGAILTGAHLEGTDLTRAVGLTRGQIDSAITSNETLLPDFPREST